MDGIRAEKLVSAKMLPGLPSLLLDGPSGLWAGCEHGLVLLGESGNVLLSPLKERILALCPSPRGGCLVSSEKGLLEILPAGEGGTVRRMPWERADLPIGLASWGGRDLFALCPGGKLVQYFGGKEHDVEGIPGGVSRQLVQTESGSLLIPLGKDGLAILPPGGGRLVGPADGLPAGSIRHVVRVGGGRVFVASDEELVLWNPGSGTLARPLPAVRPGRIGGLFPVSGGAWVLGNEAALRLTDEGEVKSRISVGPRTLSHVLEDSRGHVWLAGEGGLFRWSPEKQPGLQEEIPGWRSGQILALAEDRRGNVWCASRGSVVLVPPSSSPQLFRCGEALPLGHVTAFLMDSQGRTWIGTQGGLLLFDGFFLHPLGEEAGLSVPDVRCMAEDRFGRIWVGTGKGAYVLVEGRFAYADVGSEPVPTIHGDPSGDVWLVSGRDLRRIPPSGRPCPPVPLSDSSVPEGQFHRGSGAIWYVSRRGVWRVEGDVALPLHPSVGWAGIVAPTGAWTVDALGRLWLGTDSGVRACPETWPGRPPHPVLEEMVEPGGRIPLLGRMAEIRLNGTPQTVTIRWASSPVRETGILYRFRLDGYDTAWSGLSSLGQATYTHVPPGRYVFRILAAGAGGWSEEATTLPLVVGDGWSVREAWPAGVLALLVLAGMLVGWFQWRTRRMESILAGRTRDVEAALGAQAGELERKSAQLEHMAVTDRVTSLFDLRYFECQLAFEFEKSRRSGLPLSVVVLDLDHFKEINERWGHATGDQVLAELADLLRKSIRDIDLAARYGGDKLVFLLVNTGELGAFTFAEKARQKVCSAAFCGEKGIRITGSWGVATVLDFSCRNPEDLITMALFAVYRATANGGDRVEISPGKTAVPSDAGRS